MLNSPPPLLHSITKQLFHTTTTTTTAPQRIINNNKTTTTTTTNHNFEDIGFAAFLVSSSSSSSSSSPPSLMPPIRRTREEEEKTISLQQQQQRTRDDDDEGVLAEITNIKSTTTNTTTTTAMTRVQTGRKLIVGGGRQRLSLASKKKKLSDPSPKNIIENVNNNNHLKRIIRNNKRKKDLRNNNCALKHAGLLKEDKPPTKRNYSIRNNSNEQTRLSSRNERIRSTTSTEIIGDEYNKQSLLQASNNVVETNLRSTTSTNNNRASVAPRRRSKRERAKTQFYHNETQFIKSSCITKTNTPSKNNCIMRRSSTIKLQHYNRVRIPPMDDFKDVWYPLIIDIVQNIVFETKKVGNRQSLEKSNKYNNNDDDNNMKVVKIGDCSIINKKASDNNIVITTTRFGRQSRRTQRLVDEGNSSNSNNDNSVNNSDDFKNESSIECQSVRSSQVAYDGLLGNNSLNKKWNNKMLEGMSQTMAALKKKLLQKQQGIRQRQQQQQKSSSKSLSLRGNKMNTKYSLNKKKKSKSRNNLQKSSEIAIQSVGGSNHHQILLQLKGAFNSTNPTSCSFWEDVSGQVSIKGMGAAECREMWFKVMEDYDEESHRKNCKSSELSMSYDDDDIFQSTPLRSEQQSRRHSNNLHHLDVVDDDVFSDINNESKNQLNSPTFCRDKGMFSMSPIMSPMNVQKKSRRSSFGFSPMKGASRPLGDRHGYKDYIRKLVKGRRRIQKDNNKKKKSKPLQKISKKAYYSAKDEVGDVEMGARMSPGGTVFINKPYSESDLEDDFFGEFEDDDDPDGIMT